MTRTDAHPRTRRRAPWCAAVVLAFAPLALAPTALAQVGQPVPAFLEALALTLAADAAEDSASVRRPR